MSQLKITYDSFSKAIKIGDEKLVGKLLKLQQFHINEHIISCAIKTKNVELVEKLLKCNAKIQYEECMLCNITSFDNTEMLEVLSKYNLTKINRPHKCSYLTNVFKCDDTDIIQILIANNFDFNSNVYHILYANSRDFTLISVFDYALHLHAIKCATMILDHYIPQKQGETSHS